jgi:two-component system chemotaxis response regulator CheY
MSLDKPTVLVVDDNAFMRSSLVETLTGGGFEVVAEAGDGTTAVAAYEQHRPDVVTMDLVMPEMDGVEAIRRILDIDGYARIVVISAVGTDEKIEEAVGAGAADFLVKPFPPDRAVDIVSGALSEAGKLKLLRQQGTWLDETEVHTIERRGQATVLVVEDSAAMRTKLVDILKLAGFGHVLEAADGVEAVALYGEHHPDVVTMDLVMPNKDGMEAMAEILHLDPHAKVVVVSAMADDARVSAALAGGAREFLIKPYEVDSTVDVLTDLLPAP